jgi:uncharacterized protein YbjT (DUF2867 family)
MGASGPTGLSVTPHLSARGVSVRCFIRDESKADTVRGAGADEIAIGDLRDRSSLRRAMAGIDGLFHIGPRFRPDEAAIGLTMISTHSHIHVIAR